jgi:hypothetical protein
MKNAVLAVLAASLLVTPASAKKYDLPDANPAFSVDLPDAWQPRDEDKGASAQSPDNQTYIAVETGTSKSIEQLVRDDFDWLANSDGVTIDGSTQTSKDSTINGIHVSLMQMKAKDKYGPIIVSIYILGITDNLAALVTVTSPADGDKANGATLDKILASIKKN